MLSPEENEEVEVVDPQILERLNLDQEAWEEWVGIDDSLETGPSGSVEEIVTCYPTNNGKLFMAINHLI